MKRIVLLFPFVLFCCLCFGQIKIKNRKYPSLLWEISGNGLKKTSWLFGTMHVSSKIAFHLSDSFYLGIKNAEVIALETNPESWQEDLNRFDIGGYNFNKFGSRWNNFSDTPDDYLTIRSFKMGKYEKLLELALFTQPSVINNLLYRSYSNYSSDFEEDTYLDMYIYQAGKKLGKRISGVENYGESMKLMAEAYRDAAREKNKKEKSFEFDEELAPAKLQEAYRAGNLDLLDSINRLNSYSDAFDEKFLYKRNEIQANSIDSILKKSSLFVGVGAAHLPGPRGVIELLRQKGYRLRPILMGTRDSRHKEQVEKLRVPVSFTSQSSADGFLRVDIPGKFYSYNDFGMLDQQQYADMANGSFYMVTRVKTNSLFWGHNTELVAKKIDSVLYENVPGRILNKTEITRNGYKGFDITNRTRRGDYQRYNIFITPHEVLFFKMSGNGDYVKNGEEARKFFGSIQLKEPKNGGWKKFQPAWGGFSVDFPQQPIENIDGVIQYNATDKLSATHFTVIRSDIHNYNFAGEDSFDLSLMEESFASSEFIDRQLSRKQFVFKGYPALDCKYTHKDGSVLLTRNLIQGPHYYLLIAFAKNESPVMEQFLNSFELKPFVYAEQKQRNDTAMHYTVNTTWYPEAKKEKIELPDEYGYDEDDEVEGPGIWESSNYKSKLISNDTTGEKILVTFYKSPRFYYNSDSTKLDENNQRFFMGTDTSWIIRSKKKTELPNKTKIWEILASDTNSSRALRSKIYYRNGIAFILMTQTDTLTEPSSFVKNFFESFTPSDTVKGFNPFERKTKLFFDDFFGSDTLARRKAINAASQVELDSSDLPLLIKAISSFTWSDKKYLETRKDFINKLSDITTQQSADYLKNLYYAAGDTVAFQYAALETLLKQRTQYSYNLFRDIITSEPPVLETGSGYKMYPNLSAMRNRDIFSDFNNDNFMDELFDTLQLTRTILPDLMPLVNLDDYKWPLMRLLRTMVDSSLVKPNNYEIYFSKFLIEAKQEFRKQAIGEKKKLIEKAEEDKEDKKPFNYYGAEKDAGNENLGVYATLLLPFWETHGTVATFFQQLLASNDKRLKYNTMLLLLRNKRQIPDSLLSFFAKLDDYRYELYKDLKLLKQTERFPAVYNNHLDLGRSLLFYSKLYSQPDSLVYIERVQADYDGKQGYVYFFKYRQKKDDAIWKLATVGLLPLDAVKFEFTDAKPGKDVTLLVPGWHISSGQYGKYNFTGFTDTKIKEDEPLKEQLKKQLKKMLYSKMNSGKMFYSEKGEDSEFEAAEMIEN
jgi:uncharacterized protein YbaP (TraB family)